MSVPMGIGVWAKLTGGSSGDWCCWQILRSRNLELPQSSDWIPCFLSPCSSHCRRSSRPPVCCLPDPPLSLSHEEKGWRQLRPREETHLQESPYKWVLCLKLSGALCPSRDKWTVWKHCALQWDVLNKRSFWIEFQSDFEGGGPNFLHNPSRSANKGPMKYKESWGEKSLSVFFFS